ncbi:hypothetical protein Tco_0315907 [Tanacetum coccineum]
MSTRDNLDPHILIDPFPGREADYPPYGYTGHMSPGYEYQFGPALGGSELYLTRRSLEVLRKFHLTTLGGRFNQLSHGRYGISVPALTKDHEGNKLNTPYPGKIIHRIEDIVCEDSGRYQAWSLLQETPITRIQPIRYACMTRSSTKELFTPYKEPEREFQSSRRHFKTLSLDELRSPDFNSFSDQEYSEEEVAETMAETMERYMSKTRADYGSGVARPKIKDKDNFELKCQFLKELRTNTFSGSDYEDVNEHIEKVLKIVDLFHIPNITIDQVMLRAFHMSLTGAASR